MNMQQFSSVTGLSAHTLRYYEKIGLLRNVQRSKSGHRVYTEQDLAWVEFVLKLKETGMPLEGILRYATLRAEGSQTVHARQSLLEEHREALLLHIERQKILLAALDQKIDLYRENKVA